MKLINVFALSAAMLLASFSAQAETQTLTIDGTKGKLAAIIQTPQLAQGEKVPMVIIMHGFGGRKTENHLTMIANKLEAQSIASIRFDFYGHGESEGEFWRHTVPLEIEDALFLYHLLQNSARSC